MPYLDEKGLARFWGKIKQYVNENKDTTYLVNAPIGAIMVWSGTEDSVPQGWSICNGENGTLDLRDKFVLGAGEAHEVGETGGEEDVTLSVEQMPEHNHSIQVRVNSSVGSNIMPTGSNSGIGSVGTTSNTTIISASGSSQPHPNMPPYYTALWIQKTGVTPSDYATEERVQEIVEEALSEQPAGSNVPTGGIIIWSGASDAVPDGWALCDGTNGTPDLRGRFVLGESESHKMGSTGGAEEVTLTVAQMPAHSHTVEIEAINKGSENVVAFSNESASQFRKVSTDIAGSSQPHPNMPPYYVLCYIMKM